MTTTITHASLFSGIGGAEVAAQQMGWENLFHCEINPFGRRVLEYWFPESKSYDDITTTDFKPWRGRVTVLTGGFPCQPFSLAGARKGAEDDRYLWPQMLRAVREIQPDWVVGENVAGITTMVEPGPLVGVEGAADLFESYHYLQEDGQFTIERICRDFEQEGYSVQPIVIPACAVGAPHRRDRVWFVAKRTDADSNDAGIERVSGRQDGAYGLDNASDPDLNRLERSIQERGSSHEIQSGKAFEESSNGIGDERPSSLSASVGRADESQHDNASPEEPQPTEGQLGGTDCPQGRWRNFPTQPPVRRGHDGLPASVGSLAIPLNRWCQETIKAYGNAWVPQVAVEIFKAIEKEILLKP